MMKRCFSLLLAVLMVVSAVPQAAFAAQGSDLFATVTETPTATNDTLNQILSIAQVLPKLAAMDGPLETEAAPTEAAGTLKDGALTVETIGSWQPAFYVTDGERVPFTGAAQLDENLSQVGVIYTRDMAAGRVKAMYDYIAAVAKETATQKKQLDNISLDEVILALNMMDSFFISNMILQVKLLTGRDLKNEDISAEELAEVKDSYIAILNQLKNRLVSKGDLYMEYKNYRGKSIYEGYLRIYAMLSEYTEQGLYHYYTNHSDINAELKLLGECLNNVTGEKLEDGTYSNEPILNALLKKMGYSSLVSVSNIAAIAKRINNAAKKLPSNCSYIGETDLSDVNAVKQLFGKNRDATPLITQFSVEGLSGGIWEESEELTILAEPRETEPEETEPDVTLPEDREILASGSCGDNAVWTLTADGVLTISGSGAMDNFKARKAPWTEYFDNITTVVVEPGITRIGNYAFDRCEKIRSVSLPDTVTSIGEWSFNECLVLTSIQLPQGLTEIAEGAFCNCESLTSVVIPEKVTSIGKKAFLLCKNLKTVTLPESLTRFEGFCFQMCESLTDVVIPESVTYIGTSTFTGCSSITSINIPENITVLESGIFSGTSITSIDLPENLNVIGDYVFQHTKLTGIELPETLTSIGMNAFANCESLTGIVIPDSVTTLGNGAFLACRNLKSVTLPCNITAIPDAFFYDCQKLNNVIIPEKVTSIGSEAFWQCRALRNLTFLGDAPAISEDAFAYSNPGTSQTTTVIYYAHKSGWTDDVRKNYGGKLTWKAIYPDVVLMNSNGDVITGNTLAVDMFGSETFDLMVGSDPSGYSSEVTWKSSDSKIAAVENGTVTLKTPGTVTITATFADSDKSASVQLSVIYLDAAKKLTAKAEIDKAGLSEGQTAQILVYGDREEPLAPANLTFTSSDEAVATVDENGIVTAGGTKGTATITVTIPGDPLNRKATLSVKVIPAQTAVLTLDADVPVNDGIISLDKETVAEEDFVFSIFPTAINTLGVQRPLADGDLTWTTSDSRIATVKNGVVTVKAKSDGICVITAVTKDDAKVEASLTLQVRDYAPRLGAASLTLNSYAKAGAETDLVESYGNAVEGFPSLHDYDSKTKSYNEADPSPAFYPEYRDGKLIINKLGVPENGTHKLLLKVPCANGEVYEYPITVKVANKLPTVTVKQLGKFNTFYKDSTAQFRITAKDAEIADVRFENASFQGEFDAETGILTVRYSDAFLEMGGKPVTKGTAHISFEGYWVPQEKAVTVSTEKKAPAVTLSAKSSTVNTALTDSRIASFYVNDPETGDSVNKEAIRAEAAFATSSITPSGTVEMTLTGTKGGTVNVYVQKDNWTEAVKLTHKITVQTKKPTLKLGSTSLKLNTAFADNLATQTVALDQGNMYMTDLKWEFTSKKEAILQEARKLKVEVWGAGIIISLDPDDLPKTGTYEIKLTPFVHNEANPEEAIELSSKTFKVIVEDKLPTFKLKTTTLKLNQYLGKAAAAETAWSCNIPEESYYRVVDMAAAENPDIQLTYDSETGMLRATLKHDRVKKGTYSIKVTPKLMSILSADPDEAVLVQDAMTLKVQVYEGKPSVSVKASGKLDTIVPGSSITYTISKLTNIAGAPTDVRLEGNGAELFNADLNEEGNAVVTLKQDVRYQKDKSYKLNLVYTIASQEVAAKVTLKVTQSPVKFASLKPLNLYQSNSRLAVVLDMTAPEGAGIESITLGSKTAKQFLQALDGDKGITFVELDDGTVLVSFKVTNPGYLSYGKSYTVYLDVTPKGNAENAKPTSVKLTVKTFK